MHHGQRGDDESAQHVEHWLSGPRRPRLEDMKRKHAFERAGLGDVGWAAQRREAQVREVLEAGGGVRDVDEMDLVQGAQYADREQHGHKPAELARDVLKPVAAAVRQHRREDEEEHRAGRADDGAVPIVRGVEVVP
eukprot:scaffold86529_cov32-Tisochrysis_lutea.AAC.2